MKIRIADKGEISDQDIEDALESAIPNEGVPNLHGIQEIVLSQQVAESIKEMGMTTDEFVAMLLKQAKATQ